MVGCVVLSTSRISIIYGVKVKCKDHQSGGAAAEMKVATLRTYAKASALYGQKTRCDPVLCSCCSVDRRWTLLMTILYFFHTFSVSLPMSPELPERYLAKTRFSVSAPMLVLAACLRKYTLQNVSVRTNQYIVSRRKYRLPHFHASTPIQKKADVMKTIAWAHF